MPRAGRCDDAGREREGHAGGWCYAMLGDAGTLETALPWSSLASVWLQGSSSVGRLYLAGLSFYPTCNPIGLTGSRLDAFWALCGYWLGVVCMVPLYLIREGVVRYTM